MRSEGFPYCDRSFNAHDSPGIHGQLENDCKHGRVIKYNLFENL